LIDALIDVKRQHDWRFHPNLTVHIDSGGVGHPVP